METGIACLTYHGPYNPLFQCTILRDDTVVCPSRFIPYIRCLVLAALQPASYCPELAHGQLDIPDNLLDFGDPYPRLTADAPNCLTPTLATIATAHSHSTARLRRIPGASAHVLVYLP
jgi:hypothetical protein